MVTKKVIGRAEYAWLVDEDIKSVPARIDTGARTSTIWASNITEEKEGLRFCLFDKTSVLYTGAIIRKPHFTKVVVASSNGHAQIRYKVPMVIQIRGRRVKTYCTLADRSTQAFPMLIGRNTLNGKYVVDVQNCPSTLKALENKRFEDLQALL